MSEPESLFAALAAMQAELPHIDKGNVGDIPGKDGKRGYKYKYADLADVSQAVLPLLAKHGLAFNSKPTMVDGEFGLSYKLVHTSGEKDEGFVPFGRLGTPQQTGSLITYYRRYCLCAITGAAPDEDDDGAAAEVPYRQAAGDVFEQSAPARPRPADQGRGQVTRPAAAVQAVPEPAEVDDDAQELANEAHGAQSITDLRGSWKRAAEAKTLNATISDPVTGEKVPLVKFIDGRRREFEDVDKALQEFHDAFERAGYEGIGEMEEHVKRTTGADFEKATAAQLRQATAALGKAA